MEKTIKEKIKYRRKMTNGEYRTYTKKNPYEKRMTLQGTKRVTRKNFIRSFKRHLHKNGRLNFLSVEIVDDGDFLLYYASDKPLKKGDGIWQDPRSNPGLHSKDILLSTINKMEELEAWKSKDYKEIFKSIIIENSVSKFDSKFKSHENCYLLYSKDDFEKLLQERMGISGKMAKRLISSLFNRIKYPFLYNQQKITDSPQPSITSEKELFLELNIYAILKSVVSSIHIFREKFLDEETTEDERIDIIFDYIMADEYNSYVNSKTAYELGDMDVSFREYRKDNYRDIFKEIYEKKEDYITQFKTFWDGTISYLEETYQVPVKTTYLIDSIAEKIVPFMELNLSESILEEFNNKKTTYCAKISSHTDKEWDKVKKEFEKVMEKLKEGKELYKLYNDLKESSGISILLDSALASEHKHILEQFILYDQELFWDITSLDLMIDLHQAVESEREYYMHLTNEVREIAKVLDITVDLPI